MRHYLIVRTGDRAIIHHECDASGTITTRIFRDSAIVLSPPGIELGRVF